MDLETERQFFRSVAAFLLLRLYCQGGYVPGLLISTNKGEWMMGELDNIIEMQLILERERCRINHCTT